MTDGFALLRAIELHPDDDTPRLVYADWLDRNNSFKVLVDFFRRGAATAVSPGCRDR
jgi:uncharacterized protein (TIGR02996 family)